MSVVTINNTANMNAKVGMRKPLKPFELGYTLLRPFLLPLHRHVYNTLKLLIAQSARRPLALLDVGGRKSHYTIGLDADVTITDLPRQSDVQRQLHLGITDAIIQQTVSRRSNIAAVIYDDMVDTRIPDDSFDIVVAVEVIEHVERDDAFVANVHRILKPDGVFILTTPNGDFVKTIHNPDHYRHYTRQQLVDLLGHHFTLNEVYYAVKGSRYRKWGLRSWSLKSPAKTLLSAVGNLVNGRESDNPELKTQAANTYHLIAIARKQTSTGGLAS